MLSSEFHSDFASWALSTHEISINGMLLTLPLNSHALDALIKEPSEDIFSWLSQKNTYVKFAVKRENNNIYKIHAQTDLNLANSCGCCLELVSYNFNLDFIITMIKSSDFEDSDDKNIGYFSGNNIDLGLIIREQIFLEVPDYPRCQATCKPAHALLNTDCQVFVKTN